MSILYQLLQQEIWSAYGTRKREQHKLRPAALEALYSLIASEGYLPTVQKLLAGDPLPLPTKKLINKVGKAKKRVVYTFPPMESEVLKVLTHLLYAYDDAFAPNLYSFRRSFGVKRAFHDLLHRQAAGAWYTYKVDISDYFNSADITLCIAELGEVLSEDPQLLGMITRLLQEERVIYNGAVISDAHGMMAGVPVSSFLANVYLRKLDWHFWKQGVIYARYSDDIILFAQSEEELQQHVQTIREWLQAYGLRINPEKEVYTKAGEGWSFLGFCYDAGSIDIAPISLSKVKAKLRRKARALLRWKRSKGLNNMDAVKAFIRYLNKYFYRNTAPEEMTWSRWYFPVITTANALKEIDRYCVELIRYLLVEKHTKAAYQLRYAQIKELGFRPLVAAYYTSKQEKRL